MYLRGRYAVTSQPRRQGIRRHVLVIDVDILEPTSRCSGTWARSEYIGSRQTLLAGIQDLGAVQDTSTDRAAFSTVRTYAAYAGRGPVAR